MIFTLYGETFDIRTDHVDKVERFGDSLKITYLDGNSEVWSAKNSYQLPKINLLEIVLKALEVGYNNGWNEAFKRNDCHQYLAEEADDDYFPCSSDPCEDYGPGGYSPVD